MSSVPPRGILVSDNVDHALRITSSDLAVVAHRVRDLEHWAVQQHGRNPRNEATTKLLSLVSQVSFAVTQGLLENPLRRLTGLPAINTDFPEPSGLAGEISTATTAPDDVQLAALQRRMEEERATRPTSADDSADPPPPPESLAGSARDHLQQTQAEDAEKEDDAWGADWPGEQPLDEAQRQVEPKTPAPSASFPLPVKRGFPRPPLQPPPRQYFFPAPDSSVYKRRKTERKTDEK